MSILYTARATATSGREGRAVTDDKTIDMQLSMPGSGKPGTNPEQLFACGYGACFGSALAAVAKKQQKDVGTVSVQADVTLNQDDSGFSIGVTLNVTLPNADAATAKELVKAAHQICPYSKATRGNLEVKFTANGEAV